MSFPFVLVEMLINIRDENLAIIDIQTFHEPPKDVLMED